jgi:Spy/CpxP family protein refolding chaperone
MKHLAVFATVALLLVSAMQAFAQRDSAGVKKNIETLKTALDLTKDQTAKLETILFTSMAESRKVREEAGEDRTAMRETMREQRQKTDAKIEALLTPDQKKKYEEVKKERMQRMMERGRGQRN